jgi:hypothetical protein
MEEKRAILTPDELIESNRCSIKRGELPAKIDKDRTWRSSAVFAREEVEHLISDERIPEERRVSSLPLSAAYVFTTIQMAPSARTASPPRVPSCTTTQSVRSAPLAAW